MLVVRPEQLEAFRRTALIDFENEMVAHSKDFSPRLCEVLGEEQLRVALRQAMVRAESHGFTYRGPRRLYIELIFLFGIDFDTDPQYARISEKLRATGDQMQRAQQIHGEANNYHEKISGPDNVNFRRSLEVLAAFAQRPLTLSADKFSTDMLEQMKRLFPQKAEYVGEQALAALVAKARAKAREYRFPLIRGEALLAALMFALGHGCTSDPLYPWIARTPKDERIINEEARAQRLEHKALIWLSKVMAGHQKGEAS